MSPPGSSYLVPAQRAPRPVPASSATTSTSTGPSSSLVPDVQVRVAVAAPGASPANAKSETVATSRLFRQAFEKRRCLIPTDGFYEWKGAKPPKVPHYIRVLGDGPLFFGGIREGDTAAILTTTPNEMMADIHNRMPVIIDPADAERWLDPETKDVADLLKPFSADRMEAFAVSTKVNSARNQGTDLIEPVTG